MTGYVDVDKADNLTRKIYENNLKGNKKFASLDLSEKLRLISLIKQSILELQKSGSQDKLDALTGEFILDNLSERGFNRLRRFDNFLTDLKGQRYEVDLKDPAKRDEMLAEFRKTMGAIDLQYGEEKEED